MSFFLYLFYGQIVIVHDGILFHLHQHKNSVIISSYNQFNPFVPDGPFFYPVKKSENRNIFLYFQGVQKASIKNKLRWMSQVTSVRMGYPYEHQSPSSPILTYLLINCLKSLKNLMHIKVSIFQNHNVMEKFLIYPISEMSH